MENSIVVYRYEIKYKLPLLYVAKICGDLEKILLTDNNSSGGKYVIRSLYFDSFDDEDYYSKLSGIENRKKIRARIYDYKKDICKLELKQKFGNKQIKESIIIDENMLSNLLKKKYSVLLPLCENNKSASKIYDIMSHKQYHPVIMIDYERKAYTYDFCNVRITLDSNIRAGISQFDMFNKNAFMTPVSMGETVLEVKYDGKLPGFISAVLSKYNLTEVSYSKYQISRSKFI